MKTKTMVFIIIFPHLSIMRISCALILLCLFVCGPVFAVSMSPVSVTAVKTVGPVHQPTGMVYTLPQTTLDGDLYRTVSITSHPSGAKISVDGSVLSIPTPYDTSLTPGSYTIRLTLYGYKDYTTTITIPAGTPPHTRFSVNADLERALTTTGRNVSSAGTIAANHAMTLIPVASPTAGYLDSCTSDQKCLTLAEAGGQYAPGWWYLEAVCGYGGSGTNSTEPKYCTGGTPKTSAGPGTVGSLVPGPAGRSVRLLNDTPERSVKFFNDTPVETRFAPVGTGAARVLGGKRPVGVVDSFIGFFGGFFKPSSCPEGSTVCGGQCVNLTNSTEHCGACDYTCFDPAICRSGQCVDPAVAIIVG
jgi:hypothetical protein